MRICENMDNCTGCGACVDACPKSCIRMEEDNNGFLYPVINDEICINCGMCYKKCPVNVIFDNLYIPSFYAAYMKDNEMLMEVSSGGVSWVLMIVVLSLGGVVYGAVTKEVGVVVHERADTIEYANNFRKSKYLQSRVEGCYSQVKKDLNNGKMVLFTGVACQVAGLKSYLGRDYDNLYTIDVVCHGVPSNLAFRKYKKELEKKEKSRIEHLEYRNKDKGWKNNQYKIMLDNGKIILEPSGQNLFHSGYLSGLFYRKSCGICQYAKMPRISDMTLADYWEYQGILLNNNFDKGISLIVCSSCKGLELLNKASQYLVMERTESNMAYGSCRHLTHTPTVSSKREEFLSILCNSTYEKAYRHCTRQSILKRSLIKGKKWINVIFAHK